ncbi:hypothetical protein KJ671_01205 [Patescibacteria group bacterium]|nr:hypothetical protein [Patescibacteria group bacterium]
MKIFNFIKKYSLLFVCLSLIGLIMGPSVKTKAQIALPDFSMPTNPDFDFLISWKAINYVPADYKGKILVSKNSDIEISFDVLDNGKFIDVSNQEIEWYVNDNFLKSGIGLKNIKFTAVRNIDQFVEISIPNYKDSKYKNTDLGAIITIPSSSPEVVINTPYQNKTINIGENTFQVLPYFFGISNLGELKINWTVNGLDVIGEADKSDILNLAMDTKGGVKEGSSISIRVFVQNLADQLQFAKDYISLDIR